MNLGTIHKSLAGARSPKALSKTLSLVPNHINARLNLGVIALQDKDLTTAENYFRETLRLQPNNERASVNLAKYYCCRIEPKRAGLITKDEYMNKARFLLNQNNFHDGKASHSKARWSWCMNKDWATPFSSFVTPDCCKRGCDVISRPQKLHGLIKIQNWHTTVKPLTSHCLVTLQPGSNEPCSFTGSFSTTATCI